MNIAVKQLRKNAELPVYHTVGSAAADLAACLDESVTMGPSERAIIPTGLMFEVPVGYEVQLRARSGLSAKHGITLANGVGTIDADYRGEVGIILINLGTEPFVVKPGMRIAQMVVAPCPQVTFEIVDEVGKTVRGEGGYGSTGY